MYGCFPRTAPTVSHSGISLSSKMRRGFGGRVKDEVANVPTTGITDSAELGIVTKKKKMKKKEKTLVLGFNMSSWTNFLFST